MNFLYFNKRYVQKKKISAKILIGEIVKLGCLNTRAMTRTPAITTFFTLYYITLSCHNARKIYHG